MTGHLDSIARKFSSAWETFWYSQGNTLSLGLFRILFAICLYLEVSVTAWWSVFAIEGGFHLPYAQFIQPVTAETYGWLLNLQFPFILLLALGLCTRLSCSALFLLLGYIFFADQVLWVAQAHSGSLSPLKSMNHVGRKGNADQLIPSSLINRER